MAIIGRCAFVALNGVAAAFQTLDRSEMTVGYTADVANGSIRSFLRLMLRWKGSLWKRVWRELLLWLAVYGAINIAYRFIMDADQQRRFEDVCALIFKHHDLIPMTFMLGFYVTKIISRWSECFANLAFCDTWVSSRSSHHAEKIQVLSTDCWTRPGNGLQGAEGETDHRQLLVYRDISMVIRKRFPTLETVRFAGFWNKNEMDAFESVDTSNRKYWVPIKWAMMATMEARKDGLIKNDFAVQDIFKEILIFRNKLFRLAMFDWAPIPLLYSQVVALAVRIYFIFNLLGRQMLVTNRYNDLRGPLMTYVPIFSILEFIFYTGWLKVAEALLNPFGNDDDNFEVNWIVDRNLKASLEIVDDGIGSEPAMEKDMFWEETVPEPLYSAETARTPINPQVGSAVAYVPETDHVDMVPRVTTSNDAQNVPVYVRRDSFESTESVLSNVKRMIRNRRGSRITASGPNSPTPDDAKKLEREFIV
uniref:Bestrophin homolog n=1 Tax=Steinernema glaseri TaxID=37863 RepID=A0A1I7YD51_9BILA